MMGADPGFIDRITPLLARSAQPLQHGKVKRVTGMLIESQVPGGKVGDMVEIDRPGEPLFGEVVGFNDSNAVIIPFGRLINVAPGARVTSRGDGARLGVSERLLGRIVDAFGNPLDGNPAMRPDALVPIDAAAPLPERRVAIHDRFDTGVRAIDSLLTCGAGQRVGIFAGAGVGKTVLMRQIARQSQVDVTVIGLIGERGGEVQDLLTNFQLDRGVLVVSTSDRPPAERARGALSAVSIAEYFRDRGARVLLILDSLTRYAMALREIGLAAGEPAATKGYPPSVFATLPRLLERVCPIKNGGSITGFFTVLVEGDDLSDPVADSARSLLDGHIVLSRDLAARGHFPAIDLLASASRSARQVTGPEAHKLMARGRQLLATRREADELRSLGAYVPGHNPVYDAAIATGDAFDNWAKQNSEEATVYGAGMNQLQEVIASADKLMTADAAKATKRPAKPGDGR